MVCSLTIMMFARMGHLIVRDGCLLFFDKVDAFVPESARPVRVYVEVAGNVWGDHHRLWLVAVEKRLQEINISITLCLLSTLPANTVAVRQR